MDTVDCTRCPHLDRFGRCVAAGKMVEDLRKCPPAVGVEAVKPLRGSAVDRGHRYEKVRAKAEPMHAMQQLALDGKHVHVCPFCLSNVIRGGHCRQCGQRIIWRMENDRTNQSRPARRP